jgi:hypothetical protein
VTRLLGLGQQRALDAAEFLKRQIELVPPAVGRKLLDHGGGCDVPAFSDAIGRRTSPRCSRISRSS